MAVDPAVGPLVEDDVADDVVGAARDVAATGVKRTLRLFAVVAAGVADEFAVVVPVDDVVERDTGAAALLGRPGERRPGVESATAGVSGLERCHLGPQIGRAHV